MNEEDIKKVADEVRALKAQVAHVCSGKQINVVASVAVNMLIDCYAMECNTGKPAILKAVESLAAACNSGVLDLPESITQEIQKDGAADKVTEDCKAAYAEEHERVNTEIKEMQQSAIAVKH